MKYIWMVSLGAALLCIFPFFSALEKYKLYKISKHIDGKTDLNEWNHAATPEERYVRSKLQSEAENWFGAIQILLLVSLLSFFIW